MSIEELTSYSSENYEISGKKGNKTVKALSNLYEISLTATTNQEKKNISGNFQRIFKSLGMDIKGVGRVEKLTSKFKGGLDEKQMEREIKSKISGHYGAFKRTTDNKKQAKHMNEMVKLKQQADDFGISLPVNVQQLLMDEDRVDDILSSLNDIGNGGDRTETVREAAAQFTGAVAKTASTAADYIASDKDTVSGAFKSMSDETEGLAGDIAKTGEISMPEGTSSSYLKTETVGTGKLFDAPISDKDQLFSSRMTDVQQQNKGDFVGAEVQRMKLGEKGLFEPMPIHKQSGGSAFQDIKGLVTQTDDVHGHKEFLADRAAGKGALAGITYRPKAGMVGAVEIPGGSRWFDFPQQETQRSKINLGIKRESGPGRPALSLLGVSTKMGGGDDILPGMSRQNGGGGMSFQTGKRNQGFGAILPSFGNMSGTAGFAGEPTGRIVGIQSLIGESIVPKRKKDIDAVQKLNLFGKMPSF